MKKFRDYYEMNLYGFLSKQTIRVMKLTLFLSMLAFFQLWATESYSQLTKLSLKLENVKISDALEQIENQTEFYFLYSPKLINVENKVSIDADKESIKDILIDIFGEKVKFAVYDRQIILAPNNGTSLNEALQQLPVTGKITDASTGDPMPGVNIQIKGTTFGVITDANGKYSITVPDRNATLLFSFIGYVTQEIPLNGKTSIDVALVNDMKGLEEVVVIGYGTVKKSDLTGSVGSIKSADLNSTPTIRLDQALKGKISGLQATTTSSAPGASTSIRIRGSNSISANNEPLYVIDGFIGGFNLNDINVSNIESIEILKDASATAIYGSRGSNGVILITTKRGKEEKVKISYDSYFSYQSPSRLIPVLNASEFADYMNEVKGIVMFPDPSSYGEGTNWQKEVYRENVPMTSHTLSIAGGDKNHKYFLSGNYFNQEGISINSNLERYHFQINTDHKLSNKLKIGNSLLVSRRMYKPGSFGNQIKDVAGWQPTLPVKDDAGNYTIQTQFPEVSNDNPVATAMLSMDNTTSNKLLGTIFGEYEILNGL